MGVVENISADKFPKQGKWLGKKVNVSFNYDTTKKLKGIIIRDDTEDPGVTMIQLENGKTVLSTECHYQIIQPKRLGTDIKPVEYWEQYIQQPEIPDEEFESFEALFDLMFDAFDDWDAEADKSSALDDELKNKVAFHLSIYYHQGGRYHSDVIYAMIAQL